MKKTIVLVYVTSTPGEIHPAIYYLKEHARRTWKNVSFITRVYSQKKSASVIVKEITNEHPLLVGFSTYIWNAAKTLEITRELKKKQPGIPVVLGGPEASYNARRMLAERNDIDVIAVDEGENTFTELTGYYSYGKGNLADIRGIVFRKNGRITDTGPASLLDLNTVGSPFLSGYIPNIRRKTITYETSRGCPFKCAYCSYNTGSYARMRFFPLRRVLREISRILAGGPRKMNIVDDNFNINEPRAIKILGQVRRSVQKTVVTFFLRADIWKISEELAGLLAHRNIFCTIGVQSLNPTTLTIAQRINDRKNLDANLRLLNRHKVKFILQFIVGLPGDRYGDVRQMINWAFRYEPYGIHLQTLRINPQTVYEKRAEEYGITYKKVPPYTISQTRSMTAARLAKSQMLASHFEFIFNNRALRRRLIRIHLETHIPVTRIVEQSLKNGPLRD